MNLIQVQMEETVEGTTNLPPPSHKHPPPDRVVPDHHLKLQDLRWSMPYLIDRKPIIPAIHYEQELKFLQS